MAKSLHASVTSRPSSPAQFVIANWVAGRGKLIERLDPCTRAKCRSSRETKRSATLLSSPDELVCRLQQVQIDGRQPAHRSRITSTER